MSKQIVEMTWECENGHSNTSLIEFVPGGIFTLECQNCDFKQSMTWKRAEIKVNEKSDLSVKPRLNIKEPDQNIAKKTNIGAGLSWSVTNPSGEIVSGGNR